MTMKRALVSLLPTFLALSELLEARVSPDAPPLIKPAPESRLPRREPDSSVLQQRAVEVDLRLARDPQTKTMRLPLFDDGTVLVLVRDRLKVPRKGSLVWRGHVEGQPASTVILSVGKEALIGNIATRPKRPQKAAFYQIRYLGNRTHVLRQIDQSKLPPESPPTPPEVEEGKEDDPTKDEPPPTCTTDPSSTIDALVVYTPRARDMANGTEAMEESINVFIEETNTSYENSGVAQRLRLVHMQEVDYDESNFTSKDRNRLKTPGGELGEVHDIRDAYGADVVALIVEYTEKRLEEIGCGIAYIMETPSNVFESSAFAVVPRICADDQYSLTHEFGHLMGARHNWYVERTVPDSDKPWLYSHGYVHLPKPGDPGPAFRTLMSYAKECTNEYCDRVLYWSNPAIPYPESEAPMGIAAGEEPSNNSMTLNNTARIVANFRCKKD